MNIATYIFKQCWFITHVFTAFAPDLPMRQCGSIFIELSSLKYNS